MRKFQSTVYLEGVLKRELSLRGLGRDLDLGGIDCNGISSVRHPGFVVSVGFKRSNQYGLLFVVRLS
jgi:hypothetical protein